MELREINNVIKNYKKTLAGCKKHGIDKLVKYYETKIEIMEAERKEILKIKESA